MPWVGSNYESRKRTQKKLSKYLKLILYRIKVLNKQKLDNCRPPLVQNVVEQKLKQEIISESLRHYLFYSHSLCSFFRNAMNV